MTVTVQSFIGDFPEFANSTLYTTSLIQNLLNTAQLTVDSTVWKDRTDYGTELWLAHHLALRAIAVRTGSLGGTPGIATGPVTGKGVGGVTIGYDSGAVTIPGDGHWNYTTYGIEFMQLCRIVGAGGVQI